MENNTWTRKEYTTWEEAFRALAPAMRQESVRVAEYTQVLYQKACEAGFGAQESAAYPERIRSKYAEVAYKCGLYHQIGKALVPQEYQILQRDFTEEEIAVYRKYTADGRALAARLQELSLGAKQRRRTESAQEAPTENIPFLMIRESCAQHMERYDGSGYPAGLAGAEISPIAQIVGLAKELVVYTFELAKQMQEKLAVPYVYFPPMCNPRKVMQAYRELAAALSVELPQTVADSWEECLALEKQVRDKLQAVGYIYGNSPYDCWELNTYLAELGLQPLMIQMSTLKNKEAKNELLQYANPYVCKSANLAAMEFVYDK